MKYFLKIPLVLKHQIGWFPAQRGGSNGPWVRPLWLSALQVYSEIFHMAYIQIELDKTATSFRQAHSAREELIQQWEHTIDQMKRRDADVDRCAAVATSSHNNV